MNWRHGDNRKKKKIARGQEGKDIWQEEGQMVVISKLNSERRSATEKKGGEKRAKSRKKKREKGKKYRCLRYGAGGGVEGQQGSGGRSESCASKGAGKRKKCLKKKSPESPVSALHCNVGADRLGCFHFRLKVWTNGEGGERTKDGKKGEGNLSPSIK